MLGWKRAKMAITDWVKEVKIAVRDHSMCGAHWGPVRATEGHTEGHWLLVHKSGMPHM